MLERDIKRLVKELLDSYAPHVYYEMWVPSGYGKTGLDFNVCAAGRALFIEAKRPKKYTTARQRKRLLEAYAAGAACFIVTNDEGVEALAAWLRRNVRHSAMEVYAEYHDAVPGPLVIR